MRGFLKEWAPVVGLMLLAGAFRLYMLGAWPPGLYHDEAYYGLDALRVLAGDRSIYFAANHGREPLFIYLASISLGLLGNTTFALRLTSAIIGTLTIPATYWMARELFNRRIGLLAAAIMTVTLWPVHLSRIGFRTITLPLLIALSIAAGVHAWRSGRVRDWISAGALYGVSFYTYLAGRFTPFVLILFFIVLVMSRRFKQLWPGLLWFGLAAAIVIAPLAVTALNQWDVVMGRPGDISIFNPGINQGDLAGTAVRSTLNALGMFFWQGDRIPRHNVPYRPVFDPIMAVAFGLGLILLIFGAIRRARRAPLLPEFLRPGPDFQYSIQNEFPKLASCFVLMWVLVMLLPTILAEDSPHFLRAVGVLPVAMIIPAVGLDAIARWLEARGFRIVALAILLVAIGLSAIITVRDYLPYATDPETAYAFESAGSDLANAGREAVASGERAFIADRFVRDWTSLSFLMTVPYTTIADGEQPPAINAPARLFLWPYEDWSKALASLSGPATIQVSAGPLARDDLDLKPHVGYLMVRVASQGAESALTEAQFENGLRLLGHTLDALDDQHWRLRTFWQIDRSISGDETFFVHLSSSGRPLVSADGDSGDGFYPLSLWRPGDVIVDQRTLPLPPGIDRSQLLIELGVYHRTGGQRVKVSTSVPPVIDQALLFSGPSAGGP